MSKFYLFAIPQNTPLLGSTQKSASLVQEENQLLVRFSSAQKLAVGDKLLLVQPKGDDYDEVLPIIQKIALLDQQAGEMLLETDKVYDKKVSIDTVRSILNRPLSDHITPLTPVEFHSVVSEMGGVKLKESELLDYIKRYIAAKGYYFDEETIYNYHICLKTRPFVILAGLSGTGKSKLSQLYAEAMGHTVQNKRYLRLAVRPSWNDDRYLLGYLNSITGEYITEPAVDFILKAEENREDLYFFCLDEMNLAHVEYYFSQFLSALEEDNSSDRWIPLMSERAQASLSVHTADRVLISPNLLFTGTINVDETTQPLSDKVIDRANTIEFFAVELDKI